MSKNYRFPFDIEAQIASITNVYRAGMGLAPLESSPAADLREAPLAQEGDRDVREGSRRPDKAAGGDVVVPFRKREE